MAYPQETFVSTKLSPGSLIFARREAAATNTLMYQLDVLRKTGRYDCFKLKWHPVYDEEPEIWPIPQHLFWDSDVAKWIEGACYCQHDSPSAEIDNAIAELVEMMRTAQHPDGYLNLHYTVVEPGKRFTNLRDMHELYNAGHLIEAALAHHGHYGSRDLLDIVVRYVDLLHKTFGPGSNQKHGYPGHPEIELALLRLHARTGDSKHLELATYFIRERGNPKGVHGEHFYDVEARDRGEDVKTRPAYHMEPGGFKRYYQAHVPLSQQQTIEGHAVRATYLLTAVADLARIECDSVLGSAVKRLWNNMVQRKMYVTGGIGAIKQYEGFGIDYFLPQGTDEGGCYAETCASIAVIMLADRILKYDLDGHYGDIMELSLYNAVLTAMAYDGKGFTYVNQLASSEVDLAKRSDWFTCACCPPNMLRLLGSIGGYIYSESRLSDSKPLQVAVHLYISSSHEIKTAGHTGVLTQTSNWPWSTDIDMKLDSHHDLDIEVKLRIPAYVSGWKLSPACPESTLEQGYLRIPSPWLKQNPSFSLHLPLRPRLLAPHPSTNQDVLAVARGPIIYCVEDIDNDWVDDHFKSVQLRSDALIEEKLIQDETTGDTYVGLTVRGGASVMNRGPLVGAPGIAVDRLDDARHQAQVIDELHFVPFYFRANRGGRGQSRVGLKRWN